ncbi:MAG: autotransporter-associated beta strand repeat-containing protein [Burkholderiales bacterium]|nr:autotransporter-associated beta strand repeat-containing protein [Burkholderiales bacterium]
MPSRPQQQPPFSPARIALAVAALCAAAAAQGATFTWDGGGTNNNWSTGTNWTAHAAPPAGSDLVFGGGTRPNPVHDLGGGFLVRSITFASGAAPFSVGGSSFYLSNGLTNSSSNNQTFSNAGILLSAAQTWAAASGSIQVAAVNLSDHTLTLSASSGHGFTFAGVISGTGALVKQGAGSMTLNAANTYTGSTTISGGQLNIGATERIADASAVVMSSGTTLALGGFNETVGSLSGAGSVTLGSGTLAAGGNDASTTYAGVISGTGGFTKLGAGAMTLSGANTYSGTTLISEGTLALGASSRLAAATALSIASGAAFNPAGYNQEVGSLAGAGNVTLGSGTLTVGGNDTSTTFSGVVSGTGGLTKTGTGTLTLSGVSTYSGATTVNEGALSLSASSRLAASTALSIASGAAFNLAGFNQQVGSLAGGGSVTLGSGTLTAGGNDTSTTFSGTVSGSGGLTKVGSGTLTLSGASTYTNATSIIEGAIALGASNRLPTNTTLVMGAGGTFNLAGFDQTVGSIVDATGHPSGAHVILGSGRLTAGGDGSNTIFSGVISGAGGLTKTGAGTLTLGGPNTYIGATTIDEGTLALGASSRLAIGTALIIGSGARFNLAGYNQEVGSLSGAGNLTLGGGTLTTGGNDASTAFSGIISGAGSLTKIGAGTLTLSGNNNYTGATILGEGRLVSSRLPATTALSIHSGAALYLAGDDLEIGSLAGGGNVILGSNTLITGDDNTSTTYSGFLSGAGGLTKTGSGTLTLSGSYIQNYTGATTISGGTIALGSASSLLPLNSALTIANGATLNLAGFNQGLGSLAGAGGVALGGGTLTVGGDGSSTTFSGSISGNGGLTKLGSGTLTLSGVSSYSGATTISGGSISLGGGSHRLPMATALNVATGATLNLAGFNQMVGSLTGSGSIVLGGNMLAVGGATSASTTFSGALVGHGTLSKVGPSTLTLTSSNPDFTGNTYLGEGEIALSVGASLARSSHIEIATGATLRAGDAAAVTLERVALLGGTLTIGTGISQLPFASVLAAGGVADLRFLGAAGSTVRASGWDLTIGDAASYAGFATDGFIDAGNRTVTLNSRGFATLGSISTISGGTLAAPNGVALGAGRSIYGWGSVAGRVAAQVGSTIEATGSLALGSASAYDGFVSQGVLQVGRHAVTLRDRDQAVLGALTSMGDSASGGTVTAANGMLLPEGSTLAGHGTVNGAFKNQGHVAGEGPAPADALTFTGLVRGIGYFTGNVVLLGGYSPGNSPARTAFQNVAYGPAGTVTIELGGLEPGTEYDVIDVSGSASLDGTLAVELIGGFHPQLGDAFTVMTWNSRSGQFATITGLDLGGGLRLDPVYGEHGLTLTTAPVPEPGAYAMLLAGLGLLGMVVRRRRAAAAPRAR